MHRLREDRSGNVLALAAACVPPVLILVGGGIDMSRAYMTQTSLQNACDAGVLAGRRAQAKSGTWSATEVAKAQKMFNFNFQGNSAGATGTNFTPADAGSGVISGTATTSMPTTIMKLFGTGSFALTATCSAEFQISNIDVMMVLDTTGSMACRPDGSYCNSDSSSKIEGLKSAIRSFYYTIAAAVPAGGTTRVRFGFVPYNGTVNIKTLVSAGDIPNTYLTDSTNYQTKLYNFDTPKYALGSSTTINTTSLQSKQNLCQNWGNASAVTTGTTTITYAYVSYDKNTDICTRSETTALSTRTAIGYSLSATAPYRYAQASVDTSRLKTLTATAMASSVSSSATVPTAGYYNLVQLAATAGTTGVTSSNVTWTGCVEERSTVNTLISAASIPSGATDLDLASPPTSDLTRWHPYISSLEFDRGQSASLDTTASYGATNEYCPPAAQKFTTVDTSIPTKVPTWIENYLATLYAWGNTYHDVGMIWGGRLANPNGIMSTNVNAGNLSSVSRHIIFLTDGEMAPDVSTYSAYGIESLDNRVAPSGTNNTTLTTYHNGRFLAACQRAKDTGYTVWVIGFGQSLTTQMTSCASSGRAYYASDSAALQNTFRSIATQVADLRLKS